MIVIVIEVTDHRRVADIVGARCVTKRGDVQGSDNLFTDQAQLHYEAAVCLIEWSHLASVSYKLPDFFRATTKDHFDQFWNGQQSSFGRLICWIVFSVGAEYLAKAACLVNNVLDIKPDKIPISAPTAMLSDWAKAVCEGTTQKGQGRPDLGQLGRLCGGYSGIVPATAPLKRLAVKAKLSTERANHLIAAYRLLGDAIRNRDLHSYVHGVRDKDFTLVESVFVPAFNELVALYIHPVQALDPPEK